MAGLTGTIEEKKGRHSDAKSSLDASSPAHLDAEVDELGFKAPGTQHLINIESSQILLIPTPSADPEDPLNWSPKRKHLATFCFCVYVFFNSLANANLASVLEPLSQANGLPVSTLNAGTGYLFLLAGWGLFFWQPLALQYGKRLVYVGSLLGIVAMTMWAPYCTSSGQWYGRSILAGFFAAPVEALPELSITDLYFAHERGTYTGLYAFVLIASNFFAPFICGFINVGQGWRWVFYYPSIFAGAAAIFLYIFMEETNYTRHNVLSKTRLTASAHSSALPESSSASTKSNQSWLSHFRLITVSHPFTMHKRLLAQARFLLWPVPLWSGFFYGSALIWFNVMNATASTIFSAPPYSFPSSIVGLTYISPMIGAAGGGIYVGYLSDLLIRHLARRNNGIMHPEQRLWLAAASCAVVPASLILWGIGAANDVHWFGLVVAMAGLGFQNTIGASLAFNYLVDSYRELSGDALTAVIVVRNTMSFAVNYGISPWVEHMGLERAFGLAAGIGCACALTFLPVVLGLGQRARRASAERYWGIVRREKEVEER